MHYSIACTALAFWAGLSAAAQCKPCESSVTKYIQVKTTNGPVKGHLANNSTCVVEYLGIPYAKPPLGNLRFAPPERFQGNQPYEAVNFGFDCPSTASKPVAFPGFFPDAQRIISFFAGGSGTPQSEDCLTLNVWSKATRRSDRSSKPVMVFFYGGRFTVGNTDTPFYSGKYFADAEDVVVVTVNYRINIFGFPGNPDGQQNLGLRDMRLSVEWIRDNIKQFGGDPNKITIVGQSSGAVGVDYWTYAYAHDPIISGVIAHSGNAFSFPVNSPAVGGKNWHAVADAVGCGNATDIMGCMRQVDWQAIKAAAAAIKPSPSTSVLRTVPAFYAVPDNETVFSNYVDLTNNGKYAKVPILFGNNHNEAGFYRIAAFASGVIPTDAQVASFILESFTCPVAHQVSSRREHGVAAWAYRYLADWDNTRLYPTSGAYHGVDMHMIFGASQDVSGLPTTAEQRKLTKLMQHAWFTFMDDPENGLAKIGWPKYIPNGKTLMQWGDNNTAEGQLVAPSKYDAPCSTVTLGALGTAAASTSVGVLPTSI